MATIVVGVDGSEGGAAALQQVVQHATCPVVVVNQPATDS
jgi:nucleotide-binding universal stress UspA family protein